MINLDAKISKHTNDIIQKYASGLFKDATLEFYGIKTAKIKELINIEFPIVETSESSADFVFLLEDNSYLHFEFQTGYNKNDLIRFAHYDLRLYERDRRNIKTVIIYTADVKEVPATLKIGSLVYNPDKIMMVEYDGDAIYKELDSKIKAASVLTDVDMLKLIFLPLMRNTIPKNELAVNSIKLAQSIPDTTKRNACIAAAFAFAYRYLEENNLNKLLEVLKMTDLVTMLVEDAVKDAKKDEKIGIAKKLLTRGISIEAIAEDTGLDKSTIKKLQVELNQESA